MKKITFLVFIISSWISIGQNAPITFEPGEPGAGWTWTAFENGENPVVEIIPNPTPGGINNSPTVAKYTVLQDAAPFAGFESQHGSDIGTFTLTAENSSIKIMVWKSVISDVGIKLVTSTNASTGEIKVSNTLINQWEELTFDFSGKIGETNDQIVIFPDFQNNRTSDNICYIDNITFGVPVINPLLPILPIDFESDVLLYNFVNFGGAETTKVSNPDATGINESETVAQLIKSAGSEVWAGSYINLGAPIDFSENLAIRIKTWSPVAGIPVLLKLENTGNPNIFVEVQANTTIANAWEELTFTFPESVTANSYQRVVVFFDFGNSGNGSTYYFDDITNDEPLSTLDFEISNFRIFPNPTQNFLTVESQSTLEDLKIYSILGQELISLKPFENQINIDVSGFDNGVYLVKSTNNGLSTTKRFIKK